MTDPAVLLEPRVEAALVALGPEAVAVGAQLRRSKVADYQINAAFEAAKQTKRNPRELATELLSHLDLDDLCSSVEVAGPGYVNLVLRPDLLSQEVLTALADERAGAGRAEVTERVVVDYSAPNVAKEMHVGHLRSTVIGDALARLLVFLGHDVIRQNHLGDWGTPFGMLIEHLRDLGESEAERELSVGDLDAFYQEARKKFDADPDFAERSRRQVVALQAGDSDSMRLWHVLVEQSQRYFSSVYDELDVTLGESDYTGESTYNDQLVPVVEELTEKGLAVEDQGALCVFPPGFVGREGEPQPLIVRKSDGGFGYAATDLAAIRQRLVDWQATWLLYVVGAPQAQHLEAVFKVAEMAGWLEPPARAQHVPFGAVLGADGKMFRTRAGSGVKLSDLLAEAVTRALAVVEEKNPELPDDEKEKVAHAIGMGAVKYADLSSDRVKDYVFDWDRMLALNGNTAPYLQYAHARIRSILRKAEAEGIALNPPATISLDEPSERELALELLVFDGAVRAAGETTQPHRLTTYLYDLASRFTSFYEACPVLKAETDELRSSRLALCQLTARVLETGLGLLGIEAPREDLSVSAPELDDPVGALLASCHCDGAEDGTFEAESPDWFGDRVFGGWVAATGLDAACQSVPDGWLPHSMHAAFLGAVRPGSVSLAAAPMREGRTFLTRRVVLRQSERMTTELTVSFHHDEDGPEYQRPMPADLAPPAECEVVEAPPPFEVRWIGPTEPTADGTYESTRRTWVRTITPLPDDPVVHRVVAAWLSDMTGTAFRPYNMGEWGTHTDASIDHAVWFHRPFRADEWLYADYHTLINAGGRSTVRGEYYDSAGRLVMSMAQELLIRPVGPPQAGGPSLGPTAA